MKKQWSTVLMIFLVFIVVIFAVLNVDPVNINFGFTVLEVPLVIVIIGTLLIGVLIAVTWSTTIIMKERSKLKKVNQKLANIHTEQTLKEQKLNEEHLEVRTKLQDNINELLQEKKELNRRMSNLQASRSNHSI
ncbi:MAG TPA: lipopolysaccharide assembly protein LapA domain-containing protein [Atopostipes sp.]|nr:lipopolysaccharide assembly protein LapA domain-containing protein [Atopostipes sp.]